MTTKVLESVTSNVTFRIDPAIRDGEVHCHVDATPGRETVRVDLSPGAAAKLRDALAKALEER